MSRACPPPPDLIRLLDGELTENRAAELREHLSRCPRCAAEHQAHRDLARRLAAPVPGVPSPGAMPRLMRRLDGPEPAVKRRLARGRLALAGGLAAAVAASVLVGVAIPRGAAERGSFAARGAAADWSRKVGVQLWALEGRPRGVTSGAALAPGTGLVASYSNLDADAAYLLAFALDAAGEVHWVYPGYARAGTDPQAVRLEPMATQRAMPEAVVLEHAAQGPLLFVFVITREPLAVSSIERLAPAERSPAALRARWPQARIDEVAARVEPPTTR